ncbi:MAG: hypothetical protein ABII00_05750 [Elusimicrobiota bacterium]
MAQRAAKKKVTKKETVKVKEEQTLEQMILDKTSGKYQVIEIISFWAKQLRTQEEHRHLTQAEILELAMSDVLGGKVSEDELRKKLAVAAPADGRQLSAEKPKKKS